MSESSFQGLISEGIKQVAIRVFSGMGALSRGWQDRRSLTADVSAVEKLQDRGIELARYSGLSMDFESLAHANDEEDARRAANVGEALRQADSAVDWDKVDLDKFSPEFAFRWGTETSNVSDETLQHLWARLLKGELESPGSVSNDTMSVARDMTKERAEEFQILCSTALYQLDGTPRVVVGCGRPGRDSLRPYGLSFDVLMRLVHHRLIISEMDSVLNVGNNPKPMFAAQHQGQTWLLVSKTETTAENPYRPINGVLFTPAGEELSRVVERIPVPGYTNAMLEELDKQGWLVTHTSVFT